MFKMSKLLLAGPSDVIGLKAVRLGRCCKMDSLGSWCHSDLFRLVWLIQSMKTQALLCLLTWKACAHMHKGAGQRRQVAKQCVGQVTAELVPYRLPMDCVTNLQQRMYVLMELCWPGGG